MSANDRLNRIIELIEENGYLSVKDISVRCEVSEMTTRRDLQRLEDEKRLRRTFGGAVPLQIPAEQILSDNQDQFENQPEGLLVDRVNVLIASSLNPKYDRLLLERIRKKGIPYVAESISMDEQTTVVTVDNYQASFMLGQWAGEYINNNWNTKPLVLDMTYHLSNTQSRSRGFINGLRLVNPLAEMVLSIDGQSQYDTTYQLTWDALTVHKDINVIFAINDSMALGAIQACQDMGKDSNSIMVLTFGLEGDTLKDILVEGKYCKAGLAMFGEIVAPTCVEAAILKHNQLSVPLRLVTPHAIITPENLRDYYKHTEHGWEIRWETIFEQFHLPIPLHGTINRPSVNYPKRIGFIVPFKEHEWYRKLTTEMASYSSKYGIEFEIVDAKKDMEDELDFRRREIARTAARQILPGDVIIIDEGQLSTYLAEALLEKEDITVITNALTAFDILKLNPSIILILLGGIYRRSTQVLVGPTAENALRDLRADKLFLMVSGIALSFGLSHTNVSEVSIKQAMIRSAREVILLADHNSFDQEAIIQVAPLTVVDQLVTDDAIPASTRLELAKLGIHIILATT